MIEFETDVRTTWGLLGAVIVTAAAVVPDAARAQANCQSQVVGSTAVTEQCTYDIQGQTTGGAANAVVGRAIVAYEWALDGHAVKGRLCLEDTLANGRGIKLIVNAHRTGAAPASVVSQGPFKDSGANACSGATPAWVDFALADPGGIDFVNLDYGETWSGCDYCYRGTYTKGNPTPLPAPPPTPAPSPTPVPNPTPAPPASALTPQSAIVRYQWSARGSRTRARRLQVVSAPGAATVEVTCRRGPCPFHRRAIAVGQDGRVVSLTRLFRQHTLRPGTRIEVRVLAANATGKVVRFTTRRGDTPRTQFLCLAPGARTPGRCAPG